MPNNNYRRGYGFERRVKIHLEKEGYLVIRSGGSKKPDLVCIRCTIKDGSYVHDFFLVECKKDGRFGKGEREYYLKIQEKHRVKAYLAYPCKRKLIFKMIV